MIDVLLINSPLPSSADGDNILPPYGLGYIATALKESGLKVKILDSIGEGLNTEDIFLTIESLKPIFVGFNIFSSNHKLVEKIIESLPKNYKILLGGAGIHGLENEILKWQCIHELFLIIGEAELILPDIIKNNLKEPPSHVCHNKTVYKIDQNSIYYPQDINTLKLDRTLFPIELSKNSENGMNEISIITSRGCIYSCAFCGSSRKINKHVTVRRRAVKNICNEIDDLLKQYPFIESIRILDDLFLMNKIRFFEAQDIFKKYKNIKWRAMAHIQSFKNIDLDLIRKLRESGCYELSIGIESGSDKILEFINKKNERVDILTSIEKIFKAGIDVKGYFIYGFPTETEDDAEKTFQLAKELKELSSKYDSNFRCSVFEFRPYHGTELYAYIEDSNVVINDIKVNENLNTMGKRKEFNLRSGNYSNMDDDVLFQYIEKTLELN